MTSSESAPWADCQVCGHSDHTFRQHLDEVAAPEFVRSCVGRLREVEREGTGVHGVVTDVSRLVEREEGARKAWALWLYKLLDELEHSSDAPEVAAEIENYLLGGYAN